mmetsp:Transcript_111/g.290  ORF Transcript_111/g.290 Transcript_111/m.290 type:complete len:257 (+) Transcript_111:2553-3323(+)
MTPVSRLRYRSGDGHFWGLPPLTRSHVLGKKQFLLISRMGGANPRVFLVLTPGFGSSGIPVQAKPRTSDRSDACKAMAMATRGVDATTGTLSSRAIASMQAVARVCPRKQGESSWSGRRAVAVMSLSPIMKESSMARTEGIIASSSFCCCWTSCHSMSSFSWLLLLLLLPGASTMTGWEEFSTSSFSTTTSSSPSSSPSIFGWLVVAEAVVVAVLLPPNLDRSFASRMRRFSSFSIPSMAALMAGLLDRTSGQFKR